MVGADDDGRPVVGEGTAEGVSERMLRREADERGEDGGVDGEEGGGLVLGRRGGGGGRSAFEDGAGTRAVGGRHVDWRLSGLGERE